MERKMSKWILLAVIVALGVVGFVGYTLWNASHMM